MRVVLDTNVVVSALLFKGVAADVHAAWVEGKLELVFSQGIVDEYRKVLSAPKFDLSSNDVAFLMDEEILPFGTMIQIKAGERSWIPDDPDDDVFIDTAIQSGCDALISGDGHVLDCRTSLPCKVLSLRELIGLIV